MKRKTLNILFVCLMVIVLFVPVTWAKDTGYCYVVSYSLRDRIVYFTPIFTVSVSGAVYSDEEFVSDVKLIRSMESQFQRYLTSLGVNNAAYFTEARDAYRSRVIAEEHMAREKSGFAGRGYTFKPSEGFTYKE